VQAHRPHHGPARSLQLTASLCALPTGILEAGTYALNANKGKKERIGRLMLMHANNREDIKYAFAGDIVAIGGLKVRPCLLPACLLPASVLKRLSGPSLPAVCEQCVACLGSCRACMWVPLQQWAAEACLSKDVLLSQHHYLYLVTR
jgi:hypothetical protein